MTWMFVISFCLLACMLLPTAALADSAGSGVTGDPNIYEGVVNTGFGTVVAGDVVLCTYGDICSLGSTANWEGVLAFYNPTNGPFLADDSPDATDAEIFSDDQTGYYSLSNFLASYTGLSGNALVLDLAATPPTAYLNYDIYSPTSAVPEPGSLMLLFSSLIGLAGFLLLRRAAVN